MADERDDRAGRAARRNEQRDDPDEPEDPSDPEDPEDPEGDDDEGDDESNRSEGQRGRQPRRRVHVPGPKNMLSLRTFEGNPDDSKKTERFLEVLNNFFDFYDFESDKHKIAAMYNCFPLDSPAAAWFSEAKKAGKFPDYKSFVSEFKIHFSLNSADRFTLFRSLRSFSQRNGDSVTVYWTRLTKIISQLSSMGCVISTEFKIICFVCGLVLPIYERVQADLVKDYNNMKDDFDTVYGLALTYERTFMKNRPSRDAAPPAPPPPPVPQLNTITATCGFCKQTGHDWNNCPRVASRKAAGTWVERN